MKALRATLLVAGMTTAVVLGAPSGAHAEGAGEWDTGPASGGSGTVIETVSQTPCPTPGNWTIVELDQSEGPPLDLVPVGTDYKGDWWADLQVPSGTPGGDYELNATCIVSMTDGHPTLFYETRDFTVTGPAADTEQAGTERAGTDRAGTDQAGTDQADAGQSP